MKTSTSHPKKSPSSKAHKIGRVTPCAPPPANKRVQGRHNGGQRTARPTTLRQEFRAWRDDLPTELERDTALTPEWVAETVVQEVERFLQATMPAGFTERLAARAYSCYDRNKHFRNGLNRRGNGGRETLYMYMRHWTAGWLKRERNVLHKRLPWSFGMGQKLPISEK